MPLFKKKDKKTNKETGKTKSFSGNRQGFGRQNPSNNNIVSQQSTPFDVDPSFFDYEKVKLNHFLTDDEEYNRKKLADDCPYGNINYLNINEDYIDIMNRFNSDEKAFGEIYLSMNANKVHSEMGMKTLKNMAMYNLEKLDSDDIRRPIKSRNITPEVYSKIGKGLDKQSEKVGKKTEVLLKNMHTKVLDLNHMNCFPVNRAERFESGGTETTKEFSVVDDGVNKYGNITKYMNNFKISKKTIKKYSRELNDEERNDLYTIKDARVKTSILDSRDVNQMLVDRRTRSIENEFIPPREPKRTDELEERKSGESYEATKELDVVYDDKFVNGTRQLNLFKENEKQKVKKPTLSLENSKTYNELLSDSIQESVSLHKKQRQQLEQELYGVVKEQQTIDYASLVPINEVKMDLRIRKSEKRDFKFIPRT